jgi:uncharacterized membrane protein YqjE
MAETRVGGRDPDVDPRQPMDADLSLGELLGRLTSDFSDLVSTQVELAKVEIKEEVGRAGRGAGLLTGGGLAAFLALALLSWAAAWGLDEVMPRGVAFLIVGVVWAIAAAALLMTGRRQLEAVRVPPQTKASIEEDVEWAKHQKN